MIVWADVSFFSHVEKEKGVGGVTCESDLLSAFSVLRSTRHHGVIDMIMQLPLADMDEGIDGWMLYECLFQVLLYIFFTLLYTFMIPWSPVIFILLVVSMVSHWRKLNVIVRRVLLGHIMTIPSLWLIPGIVNIFWRHAVHF